MQEWRANEGQSLLELGTIETGLRPRKGGEKLSYPLHQGLGPYPQAQSSGSFGCLSTLGLGQAPVKEALQPNRHL